MIQLEVVRDCYHNLVISGWAQGDRQDTANERARAGTHERALTCGVVQRARKERRERERDRGFDCGSN